MNSRQTQITSDFFKISKRKSLHSFNIKSIFFLNRNKLTLYYLILIVYTCTPFYKHVIGTVVRDWMVQFLF